MVQEVKYSNIKSMNYSNMVERTRKAQIIERLSKEVKKAQANKVGLKKELVSTTISF